MWPPGETCFVRPYLEEFAGDTNLLADAGLWLDEQAAACPNSPEYLNSTLIAPHFKNSTIVSPPWFMDKYEVSLWLFMDATWFSLPQYIGDKPTATVFYEADIDGRHWLKLGVEQLQDLGVTSGQAGPRFESARMLRGVCPHHCFGLFSAHNHGKPD